MDRQLMHQPGDRRADFHPVELVGSRDPALRKLGNAALGLAQLAAGIGHRRLIDVQRLQPRLGDLAAQFSDAGGDLALLALEASETALEFLDPALRHHILQT